MSRAFTASQKKWWTPQQECFAIVKAIEKFDYLLRDAKFILHTDHQNLTLLDMEGSKMIRTWKMALMEYDFDIEFIKGEDNVVADYFSRLPMEDHTIEKWRKEVECNRIVAPEDTVRIQNMKVNTYKEFCIPEDKMCILFAVHNKVVGHTGVDRMMERLKRQEYQWPYMRNHCREYIK